jgi:hypothetical protein
MRGEGSRVKEERGLQCRLGGERLGRWLLFSLLFSGGGIRDSLAIDINQKLGGGGEDF